MHEITRFATGGLTPDLTLLLDLSADDGLRRREEGGSWNRLDEYSLEFHRRVLKGYHELVATEPERWVVINAASSIEAVQDEIRSVVEPRLAGKGA